MRPQRGDPVGCMQAFIVLIGACLALYIAADWITDRLF